MGWLLAIRRFIARRRGFPGVCEECGGPTYRNSNARLCFPCKAQRREEQNTRYRKSERGRAVYKRNAARWHKENPEKARAKSRRSYRKHREKRLAARRDARRAAKLGALERKQG